MQSVPSTVAFISYRHRLERGQNYIATIIEHGGEHTGGSLLLVESFPRGNYYVVWSACGQHLSSRERASLCGASRLLPRLQTFSEPSPMLNVDVYFPHNQLTKRS